MRTALVTEAVKPAMAPKHNSTGTPARSISHRRLPITMPKNPNKMLTWSPDTATIWLMPLRENSRLCCQLKPLLSPSSNALAKAEASAGKLSPMIPFSRFAQMAGRSRSSGSPSAATESPRG